MKILHVLNGSHYGGASVMAAELAAAQRARGTDAQVCLLEGGATAERIRQLGVPVLAHDPVGPLRFKRDRWNALHDGFIQAFDHFHPDIIHSHLALPNILCARLKKVRKIKWIATLHGSWRQYLYSPETTGAPWRKPYLFLRYALGVAWTTRHADRIVTMTSDGARDWHSVGISRTRSVVIPNGISPPTPSIRNDAESHGESRSDSIRIGSLGYMAPVKGFDLLVSAFDRIAAKFPSAHLVIAGGNVLGNSKVRESLKKQIETSRFAQRILLHDEQTSGTDFIAALDCYVVSSRSEGMSLALLEAMHLGKPCVVSSAGGNPEAIRDGVDGLVFQSGNVADLASRLERILADPKLAAAMGDSGKIRARTYLTLDRCAQDYLNLYNEVLKT